jgi:hypothetical protein
VGAENAVQPLTWSIRRSELADLLRGRPDPGDDLTAPCAVRADAGIKV